MLIQNKTYRNYSVDVTQSVIRRNYSGIPIFEYNTDFIGAILKTKKFEYLILKVIVKAIKNRTDEQCRQWKCLAADKSGFF